MADFSLGSSGTGRLEAWENWNSSTQVSMHYKLQCYITNGAYNAYGPTAGPYWEGSIGGGHAGNGYWTYTSNGWRTLREFDVTFNKDANGNISIGVYGYINGKNSPYVGIGSTSWTHYPARIGIAPGIAGIIADTIKTTSARLGGEITGYGLGTSANMTMYYRLQGSGSWLDQGNQADVGGYNYWNVTGLKPGKTYEYVMNVWNNNGDFAQSSVQTFKTKPVAGLVPILMGMV